jgi:hypothetical protein
VAYTTDDLVTDVQRDSYLPVAQRDFSSSVILNIADQELQETIAPALVAFDDGWFLETDDQDFAASTADYVIPRYAMWGKVRRAEALTSSGDPRDLVRLTQEQVGGWDTTGTGTPNAYLVMHDVVRVYPKPSDATEDLRLWIYRRPGRMVPTTSAAQVSSVNSGTGVVTYTGAPPATFTSSSTHDFYRGTSPFRRIGTAKAATAQTGSTQTFSTTNAALLTAGDWVCVRDETVFPAIPIELHPFLKDLVIRSMARTQGDAAQYQRQRQEIADRMMAVLQAGPGARVVGQPKRISIPVSRVYPGRRRRFISS